MIELLAAPYTLTFVATLGIGALLFIAQLLIVVFLLILSGFAVLITVGCSLTRGRQQTNPSSRKEGFREIALADDLGAGSASVKNVDLIARRRTLPFDIQEQAI
jgi:membrane-bound ClpP family serine protease